MSNPDKFLVVISGPTASGKTDLSITVAQHFGTEIVSSDSRQFYREMNIGTAKPTEEQLKKVKHHFINNKSVTELFGAGHYAAEASALLDQLFNKYQVIVLTGGSGLYIDALLHGVDEFDEIPEGLREELNKKYRLNGIHWLQDEVKKTDPAFYAKVDRNNPQRLLRALEVTLGTGRTYSSFLLGEKSIKNYKQIPIMLEPPRQELYERINRRVDEMMKAGLLEEVRSLQSFREYNALKTVGYKELFEYLDGKHDLSKAIDLIKQHTRNYAKRQLTWFRNRGQYKSFDPADKKNIIDYIQQIVKNQN